MKAFSIVSPSRVIFGAGSTTEISEIVKSLAKEGAILVLSDKGVSGTGVPAKVAAALGAAGYAASIVDTVPPEPSIQDLDAIAATHKGTKAAAIVAIGGGSVMDAAKVLAILVRTGWTTSELAEKGVPGRGIPTIMVPTTAGTGSESTPNAIVLFPEKNLKVGIVSPDFMPDRVVLDPELTLGLPPKLTASTGVDAFCHLLECFISRKANPMSDMMAHEGMRLLLPALPVAYKNGADLEARSAAMLAAYYGGACIAASGTTAIHALSYPLGGTYRIPHGVANAALLVPVMSYQKDKIAPRLAEAARVAGMPSLGSDRADAEALIERLRGLVKELNIPSSLSALGVPESDLGSLTEAAFGVRRLLDNNPIELSREDILAIYESVR
ncbi:MAG: iron-containing alcohol dehydrogenase [Candidatus Shapirobacteria bacterium]|jgi:alcohol dehydrogenase class IV